jgi:hypothetical protein
MAAHPVLGPPDEVQFSLPGARMMVPPDDARSYNPGTAVGAGDREDGLGQNKIRSRMGSLRAQERGVWEPAKSWKPAEASQLALTQTDGGWMPPSDPEAEQEQGGRVIRFGDGIVVFEEDAHGIGHTAIQRGRRVLVDDEEDEDDDMAPYGGRNERWQSRGTGWQQRGRGMHRPRGRPPGSTREREIVMGRQDSARLQEVEFDDLVTSRGLGRGNRKARGGAGIGPSRTAHSWRDAHGMGKEEEGESQESQEMNAQDFLNAVAKTMREASRPDSWGPSVSSGESRPRGRPGGAGAARGRRTADSSLRPAARRGPGRPRKAAESNEALHGRCFEETGDEEDGTSTLSSLLPRSEGQTTVGRRGRPPKDKSAGSLGAPPTSQVSRGPGRPKKAAVDDRWDWGVVDDITSVGAGVSSLASRLDKFAVAGPSGEVRAPTSRQRASALEGAGACAGSGRGRPRKVEDTVLKEEGWGSGWTVASVHQATERRGRGRPRKDAAAVDASTLEDSVATERRGRGRPRKDAAEADASTLEDSVATESVATERRGRGRPRKDAAEADASTLEDSVATERRGRGRPRKDAAAVDSLVEARVEALSGKVRSRGRPRRTSLQGDLSRSRGVPGGASLARKLSDEEIGWESEIVVSATPLANIGAGKEWGRPDTYAGEDILIQAAASEMERGSQQLRRGRGWLSKERSSDVTVAIDEANSSYSSMLEQEDDGRQADSSNFGDAPRRVDSHDEDLRRSDAHQKDDIATGENSADGLSSPGGMLVERNAESVEWNIAREGDVGVDWSNDAEESGEKEKAKGSLVPAIISADKVDGLVREAVQRGLRHPGSPLRVENKLPVLSPLRAGSISPMRRMHGHSAETTDEPEDSAEAVEESTKKDAREVYHGSAVLEEDVPDAADAEQQWELDEGQGHALSCGRGKDEVGVGMGLGKVWWRIRTLAGGGPAQRG